MRRGPGTIGEALFAFLARRVLLSLPALLGVAFVVFLLMRAVPGDVVTNLVGLEGNVTPERLAELRRMFGLDLPVHVQFSQWLSAALRGDLGSSLRTGRPVGLDLALRFPVTLQLTLLSLLVALLIALPAGIAAALERGRAVDYMVSTFALLGLSVPSFFLGILLILFFSLRLRWLPPAGYVPFFEAPIESLKHMLLPSISLGLVLAAASTRIVRSTMLEVLNRDYVRTARAKGAGERARPLPPRPAQRAHPGGDGGGFAVRHAAGGRGHYRAGLQPAGGGAVRARGH